MDLNGVCGSLKTEDNNHDEDEIKQLSETVNWKDVKYQVLSSNVAYLFSIHPGINLAFSNLLLNEFDTIVTSWFASIMGLATPIGAFLSGPLMDNFGRKRTNVIMVIPCVAAWFLTFTTTNDQIMILYVARFLSGIAVGLTISNMVYVSEISHKKYRPVLLSFVTIYFSFGILLTTILKFVFTWRQTALVYAIFFTFVAIFIAYLTPESPLWLACFRGDYEGAKRSLRKLNTNPTIFEEEWLKITQNMQMKMNTSKYNFGTLKKNYVYKPMCCLFILFLLQQLTGVYVVTVYAIKIFPQISPIVGKIFENESFVLFGILRFVTSIFGSLMSIKIGRKLLLLSSTLGMLLSCVYLTIGTATNNSKTSYLNEWLTIIMFLLFICFGTFGVMCIPWTLIVELIPTEARSIGSSILLSYSYILIFVFVKIFPFVMDVVRLCDIFAFFCVVLILLTIFVYIFIPETLGKSLLEIEQYFGKSVNE